MAFWGRIQAFLTGAAISRASSDAVGPVMEPVRQKSFQKNAVRVLDPGTLAEAIAKLIVEQGEGQAEAERSGFNANRLQALTLLAQTWPGLGELDRLANRNLIDAGEVITALHRHGFPDELVGTVQNPGPLVKLFQDILTPGELAAAIHRGLVPDPGLLQGEQPAPPFKVDAYPVYDIDAVAEAAGSGYDRDRLGVLVGLQGLPMGTHEAAQAFFRGIITHGDYIRAFNESNSRNEWAQAVLDYTRQIPTARDFFENALRGYHDLAWAQDQAKRHGMSEADSLVIYQNQGRPMNIRQITQALARGAKFNPEPGELRDPYDASVVEGNIKPAYYELAKALRYTPPTVFAIRQLAEAGVWDEAKTRTRLLWLGWFPDDAAEVAKAWTAGASSQGQQSPVAKLATTQARAALKKRFLIDRIDGQGVLTGLELLGSDPAEAGHILEMWTLEKGWLVRPLTPSQIKKLYKEGTLSIDEAADALIALHMTDAEARELLQS